jgi:H+/Cl- antiporter ClcA
MNDVTPSAAPPDPAAILRSRNFVLLLVLAAVVGVVVSLVGWAFLEVVHYIQEWVFTDLPSGLGLDPVPTWWALPVCTLAGFPVALAIARLPGQGGHVPADGLHVGGMEANMLPGVIIAALATLGLGIVLGPEAPLIAIGTGVAILTVQAAKRDAAPQLLLVIGAAGAFASISVLLGSPIISAVLVIEAAGLGGSMLPLILIPGLIASGIGSLVFIGMSNWTGLSNSVYSLPALHLTPLGSPSWGEIGWTILLGLAVAVAALPIRQIGWRVAAFVPKNPWVVVPGAGFAVGLFAMLFAHFSGASASLVLFSGQDSLGSLVSSAGAYSVGTLLLIVLFKGLAWGASLGAFRGGPTFPAMFIGVAGGIAASHLPGLPSAVGIAVGMGAMVAAVLKLPLSAIVIAAVLTASGGAGLSPLIIVGVVVAYLATLALEGRLGTTKDDASASGGAAATAA